MSKSILVNKGFLYNKLEEMIIIAKKDNTSKIAIGNMECVRNNIHHAVKDTTELLEALVNINNNYVRLVNVTNTNDYIRKDFNKLYKALGGVIDSE